MPLAQTQIPVQTSNLPDRELDNVLLSGEIGVIYLGGTTPDNKVLTRADLPTGDSYFRKDTKHTVISSQGPKTIFHMNENLEPGEYQFILNTYAITSRPELFNIDYSVNGVQRQFEVELTSATKFKSWTIPFTQQAAGVADIIISYELQTAQDTVTFDSDIIITQIK